MRSVPEERQTRRLSALGRLRLVGEILVTYLPSWRVLRTGDLEEMVRFARHVESSKSPVPPEAEHDVALQLGYAVQRTLSLLPTDGRCLIRSVVLTRMLERRSIDNKLVIGVQNEPFAAHAWVEHEGVPVLPRGTFARLTEM